MRRWTGSCRCDSAEFARCRVPRHPDASNGRLRSASRSGSVTDPPYRLCDRIRADALEAFDAEAVDYLLKPFEQERFTRAIGRVRRAIHTGVPSHQAVANVLRALTGSQRYLRRIAVKHGSRVAFIQSADVDWLEATGNYVTVHVGRESHLIREPIANLQEKLDPSRFVRVHRCAIVNLDRVREVTPWSRGEQAIILLYGTRIPIGRAFRAHLQRLPANEPR
jgi:two-component system, LytTR family, response regulator